MFTMDNVFRQPDTAVRMVAILDTWEQPVYLQRIWIVYEQFVASTLEIQARRTRQTGGLVDWFSVLTIGKGTI